MSTGSSCRRRRRSSPPTVALCSWLLLLSCICICIATPPVVIVNADADANVAVEEEQVCTTQTPMGGSCLSENKSLLSQEDTLVQWILSLEGGSVATDKFNIERNDYPDDSLNPEFEFIATQDIPKGTILMEIPESAVIGGGNGNGFFLTQQQIDDIEKEFLPKPGFVDAKFMDDEIKYAKKHIQTCLAIEVIVNERDKGADSLFHPYIEFVFGTGNPKGKKPAEWSKMGQFIFWGMLGQQSTVYTPEKQYYNIKHSSICEKYKETLYGINPSSSSSQTGTSAKHKAAFEKLAYYYFARHSWGTNLIPLFDMIPHRNGKWKNVEARLVDVETGTTVPVKPREQRYHGFVRESEPSKSTSDNNNSNAATKLVVYAHQNIAAGEPLRVSYNQCEDLGCEYLKYHYTSSNFIADAGIVEEYPHRWSLHVDPFETDEEKSKIVLFDVDLDPETGQKTYDILTANNADADEQLYKLSLLTTSVDRWDGLKLELLEHTKDWKNETSSGKFEYEAIWGFYEAYTEAIHMAWLHRNDVVNDPSTKSNGGSQQHNMKGYDDLTKFSGPALQTKGQYMCCADGEMIDDGKLIGEVKGFYQKLKYYYEAESDNTYMIMATWLHSASNFRAHYHESVIHVALQYVKNPKRVAYIGGGDNMVLAEVLKYPGIEKVVGLELDQQACRSSMKYFGTSPAFHDDRVEWWFGNGANSLQLIPEDYFGSFDLVLVDLLTDVAEAIPVTADMCLAEVAPLLMKQDGGVLARNEDMVDRSEVSTRMAQRVVMYDYWDVPRLCEGSMTIASNSIDFAKGERYNHGVKTLVRLTDFDNDAFMGWSRYYDSTSTTNTTMNSEKQDDSNEDDNNNKDNAATTKSRSNFNAGVCNKIERALPEYYEQQQQKPTSLGGVLLVIEAENVTESLEPENLPAIHERISIIAKDHKLFSFATFHEPQVDVNAFMLMCDLGYIKIQTYPEFKYVAFDLVLWGDNSVMEKFEAIQKDLIAAVGGGTLEGSVSSYRVSTGGMSLTEQQQQQQQRKEEENNRSRDDNGLVEKAREYYCGTGGSGSSDTGVETKPPGNKEQAHDNDVDDHKKFEDLSILIREITSGISASNINGENLPSTVAIFCGTKDAANCESYRNVSSTSANNSNATFHPVYSCESFEDMEGCESEITQRLLSVVTEDKRLDGFVLDSSVPLDMGKILHKVFNNTIHQARILERSFIALAPIDGDESSSWRNILLDRFRTEIVVAPPVHKADFELSNGIHSEAWSVVSIRRDNFFGALQESLKAISEKTGWVTTTKKILDSIIPVVTDWGPYAPSDEDFFRGDVMEQWFNQRPLANQFLLQMEVGSHPAPLEVGERVLVGKEFLTDSIYANPKGFLYEYYEATISDIMWPRYGAETKSHVLKDGKTVKFYPKYSKFGTKPNMVSRDQIRKISPTELNRRYDVGDIVLVQQRHHETGEVMPEAWFVANVMSVSKEGVSIRPKDDESKITELYDISPEEILVYHESPEFSIREKGFPLETLEDAFEDAASESGFIESDAIMQNFKIGNGYLVSFLSSQGSGIMKWDGEYRVEVNMLITDGNPEEHFDDVVKNFSKTFLKALKSLKLVAQDTFPRGYGKVVNFKHEMLKDLTENGKVVDYVPLWMNRHVPEAMQSSRGPEEDDEFEDEFEEDEM
jgi:spermidine synthase